MNRNEISKIAEYLGIGFRLRLFTQTQIVKWCDDVIEREANPDKFFIDISMAVKEKPQYFSHLLNQFVIPGSEEIDTHIFLAILYDRFQKGLISMDTTIRALNGLNDSTSLTDEEKSFVMGIDDDYEMTYGELGKELYEGSFKPIREKLEAFLIKYKDVNIPFTIP